LPLPQRPFLPFAELAVRWKVAPAHLASLAAAEIVRVSIIAGGVRAGGRAISGLVAVPGADCWPLFVGRDEIHVGRVRDERLDEPAWEPVESPADGIAVRAADLVISQEEIEAVENQYELAAAKDGISAIPRGRPRVYDWDGFYAEAARILFVEGRPKTNKDFAVRMETWFMDKGMKEPDLRQIQKRIADLLRHIDRDESKPQRA